jgi:hypothetical protein
VTLVLTKCNGDLVVLAVIDHFLFKVFLLCHNSHILLCNPVKNTGNYCNLEKFCVHFNFAVRPDPLP